MKILVYSRSKYRMNLIEKIVGFLVDTLKLKRSRKTLTIYVVTDYRRNTGNMGSTVKPDDDNIAILLDSRLGDDRMLLTLAHEMVHVFQFARGLLKPGAYGKRSGFWFWRGRRVEDGHHLPPWERQAYLMETDLLLRAKHFFNAN